MGLEALPAQWHLLSGSSPRPPPRPFLSVDVGVEGPRTRLTRRFSDASECSLRGSSSRKQQQAAPTASVDGEAPSPSFLGRAPWITEKGTTRGPSSSLRVGQGPPGQRGPNGLVRWKSEGAGMMRKAVAQFEEFPGDRSRDEDSCDAEAPHRGFERLDEDVAVNPSSRHGARNSGTEGWFRREQSLRYDNRGVTGERGLGTASAEVSVVDVIAPSFVRDRQFVERREEHFRGRIADRSLDLSFVDRQPEGLSCVSRPSSLKRKTAKVCPSRVDSARVEGAAGMAEEVPLGLGARVGCLSVPDSLRKLKRRSGRGVGGADVCSIKNAFDSMVFMIRTLQNYTLQMRQILVSDDGVQQLISIVHREMHSSFVWLFQQVFSCTPTLMVSVMILLANFTVYSVGNNVALGAMVSPDLSKEPLSILQTRVDRQGPVKSFDGWNTFSFIRVDKFLDSSPLPYAADVSAGHGFGNFGSGGIGGKSVVVAGGEDGDYNARGISGRNTMFSEKDSNSADILQHASGGRGNMLLAGDNTKQAFPPKIHDFNSYKSTGRGWTSAAQSANSKTGQQRVSYRSLLEQTARELELKPGESYHHVQLDQETLRLLVAPVAAKMDSDNYLCFDRTDLEYQQAIYTEPANPMLLANYAQFLYAVRHDNSRAERFFHRALKADSKDGDILARWASFLWLALKDRPRAETAYREAIALDPSNPYHAGSYAYFLWHADDDEGQSSHPKLSFRSE